MYDSTFPNNHTNPPMIKGKYQFNPHTSAGHLKFFAFLSHVHHSAMHLFAKLAIFADRMEIYVSMEQMEIKTIDIWER